ncbi:MAG: aldehyde dehydrogenase family protein [Candidatus Acidiferrales bacterium]
MSLHDTDLISIQEARAAVERAHQAQQRFAEFSQAEVDAIVDACAAAATEAGEQLARVAVEETGYGNVTDKTAKNRLASVDVHRAIRGMKTVGIVREDREKAIAEVAEPFGVVAAVIPVTNPTSTAIYKTLISLKSRNAIVLSPHPSAMRCICETASVLERAALKAGAPEGIIVCLNHPTMQGTQELMKHRMTGVILATGGTGLVRAAYSSGKPAYGVGPGNVPAMIERTANVKKAVADIFAGKTFDYGTICSSEQAIVTEDAIRDKVLEECRNQGAYFLSEDEIRKLGELVFRHGHVPDAKVVGKHATVLAEQAGIKVPANTRVLIARLEGVGREYPLSAEKLSPILAFYSAPNFAGGAEICQKLLRFGGAGHTASVHTQNEAAAREYGQKVPASRVCVNTSAVHGSVGYSTNLFPAMTLGCGSAGGNITSDNIGPHHLMNLKRIAWESRPVEHRTIPADQRLAGSSASMPAAPAAAPTRSSAESRPSAPAEIPAATPAPAAATIVPDRQTIAKIVEQVFTARGIQRGSAAKPEAANPSSEKQPTPAEVAAAAVAAHVASSVAGSAALPSPSAKSAESSSGATNKSDADKPPSAKPSAPEIKIMDFVSENDIRVAMTKQQKIFIGPKTIVTPAARDLGDSHEILIMTAA